MHDPMIVAFDIHLPLGKTHILPSGKKWKSKNTLLTIWHNDPETDGSDDSCGWSSPKTTDREKKIIDDILNWEKDFPFFSSDAMVHISILENPKYEFRQLPVGDCLGYVAAAWGHIAWARDKRRKLTAGEWWEVSSLATNPNDNLRAVLSDHERKPSERAKHFLYCVMRAYLRYHRPWYRHPRWHVKHWKLQCHPLQTLQRWLFSRCAGCGKRFQWGYSPTSSQWEGTGPRWFWSERGVYHQECYPVNSAPAQNTRAAGNAPGVWDAGKRDGRR